VALGRNEHFRSGRNRRTLLHFVDHELEPGVRREVDVAGAIDFHHGGDARAQP